MANQNRPVDLRTFYGLTYEEFGRERPSVDCWGLCRLVYRERLGILLPSFDTVWPDDRETVHATAGREAEEPCWNELPESVADLFDVVLFSRGGRSSHVGVYVPTRLVLHIRAGARSAAVAYSSDPFLARQSRRFYRHRAR
jgi:cell wall-associated NlpC family hydrolase